MFVAFSADGTDWSSNSNDKICSAHFVGNKKSPDELSPSFIPTIFSKRYKSKILTQQMQMINR